MREQAMDSLLLVAGDTLASAGTNTLLTVAQATENLLSNPDQMSEDLMVGCSNNSTTCICVQYMYIYM